MAKSRETYSKKENEKKKQKKRQDKEQRKDQRDANKEGKTFEDMIAYVDENGNLTTTPPDRSTWKKISKDDIELGAAKREKPDLIRKGKVSFFDDSKGFGFIIDKETEERVFVHINSLDGPIKENDRVTFEVEPGPKGPVAVNVQLIPK